MKPGNSFYTTDPGKCKKVFFLVLLGIAAILVRTGETLAQPTMSACPATVYSSQDVVIVSYSNAPGNAGESIGIYYLGAGTSPPSRGTPQSLNNSKNGSLKSSTLPYVGEYEFRMYDAQDQILAVSNRVGLIGELPPQLPPEGLISYWDFDEGKEATLRDSVGGNDGTIQGGAWVDGVSGGGLYFTGYSGVVIPDSDSLDLTTHFTLEAWINPVTDTSPGGDVGIISKVGGAGGNYGYQLALPPDYKKISMIFNAADENWADNIHSFDLEKAIPPNQWSYIATTYDNEYVRMYFNGELVGEPKYVGPKSIANSTSNFRISGDDNDHAYFLGYIDEVRVYEIAISAAEIQNRYENLINSGTPPPELQPCLGVYPSIVSPGETITITFGEAPGGLNDWIGIFPEGAPSTDFGSLYYLSDEPNYLSGQTFGSVPDLEIPAEAAHGIYEIRMFPDDQYEPVLATTTFRVGDAPPEPPSGCVTDSRMVAYWKFDDGSGSVAIDSSCNGHNGSFSGNPKWSTGKFGSAAEFDGSSVIEVPHADDLNLGTYSLMAWVKVPNNTGDWQNIIYKEGEFPNRNYGLYLNPANGTIHHSFLSASVNNMIDSTSAVIDGEWHHVCGTYDKQSMRTYIDGVLESEAPVSDQPVFTDAPVGIGLKLLNASIDEMIIFNTALGEEEIKTIMQQGIGTTAPAGSETCAEIPGHSYEVVKEAKTWHDAKAYAESIGGYLVTISNAAENQCVLDIANKNGVEEFWIGLTDEAVEGTFVWVTGEPLNYQNWHDSDGQPDNNAGNEHYVEIGHPSHRDKPGSWNDYPNLTLPFVVEFNAPPSTGLETCEGFPGHLYEVVAEAMTWSDAKAHAEGKSDTEGRSGHLVTISNNAENRCVTDMMIRRGLGEYWIGLTDEAQEGTFVWVTGEDLDSTWSDGEPPWYPGEPNNKWAGEHHVSVSYFTDDVYAWNDGEDFRTHPFVIEYDDGGTGTPIGEGVIAHWKLDEIEGDTAYDSEGDNHGAVGGPYKWGESGVVGRCLKFEDSSNRVWDSGRVRVSDSNRLNLGNKFTLEAWIKPASSHSGPNTSWGAAIIAKVSESTGNKGYQLRISYDMDKIILNFSGEGESWGTNYLEADLGNQKLQMDQWYYIVATYDNEYIRIYLDGALVNNAEKSVGPKDVSNSAASFKISGNDNGDLSFNGWMDEVVVRDVALSATDIKNRYEQLKGGGEGIIAHWKLDEVDGETASDSEGDNHGTVGGPYKWEGSGVVDGCLKFEDHNDSQNGGRVLVLDTNKLNLGNKFTLEAWIKPASSYSGPNIQPSTEYGASIISKVSNATGAQGYGIGVSYDMSKIILSFNGEGEPPGTNELVADLGNEKLQMGQWYYLVATYDNKYMRIYLDGALVDNAERDIGSKDVANSAARFRISGNDNGDLSFYGWMDEVVVRDVALTATEIKNRHEQLKGGGTTPQNAMQTDIAMCTVRGLYTLPESELDREINEIVNNVKSSVKSITVYTSEAELASWVQNNTGDDEPDVLILFGVIHNSIYPGGNSQPNGSIAENFLDDGNMIINTGEQIFYRSTGTDNGWPGLDNMMNLPGVSTWNGITEQEMVITDEGSRNLDSLKKFTSSYAFDLTKLASPWEKEVAFAQNGAGTLADPVVLHDGNTNGRLAIFHQEIQNNELPRGEVISEFILKWWRDVLNAQQPPLVPIEGRVSYWKLDEGMGRTAADFENRNHGTLEGGSIEWTTGVSGDALSFDGMNTHVLVPDSDSLKLEKQFTLEAWIKPEPRGRDVQGSAIISKVGDYLGNNGYELGISQDISQIILHFNAPGEAWATNELVVNQPLSTDDWNYIVGTYDNEYLRIYYNGALVGEPKNIGAKNIASSTANLRISGNDNLDAYFYGDIDEVAVHNVALSLAEIQSRYQSVPGSGPGPMGDVYMVVSPRTVLPGGTVTLTFSGAPGNSRDWISIFRPGTSHTEPFNRNFLEGQTSGSIDIDIPLNVALGTYEFRMFPNDQYEPMLTFTTFVVGESPQLPPDEGLVSLWKFDETEEMKAKDSKDGNDGTVYSMLGGSPWREGAVNGALDLDGSTYVTVADSDNLDFTTEFTLEAFINPGMLVIDNGPLIAKVGGGAGGENGYELRVSKNSATPSEYNRITVAFNAQGETWATNKLTAYLLEPLSYTHWYHVVATYDNEYLRIYLNGGLVKNGERYVGSKSVINSASPLMIGSNANRREYFSGRMDEAAVYNRALPPEVVSQHYTNVAGTPSTQASVSVSPDPVALGGTIVITWSGAPDSPDAWVGLFKEGASNREGIVSYGLEGKISGSSSPLEVFSDLTPGTYEIRMFRNDQDETVLASTSFQVNSGTAPQSNSIIKVVVEPLQPPGTDFSVEIQVGDENSPVNNLFGLSFKFKYTNTTIIDASGPALGDFIGTDSLILPNVDDASGTVSIGISKKAGSNGANGYGTVAKINMRFINSAATGSRSDLTLIDVTANDPNDNSIQLTPQGASVAVGGMSVWPGDTDNNGLVDERDVLRIGIYWKSTGPARSSPSNNWVGQSATAWNPKDGTYADASGDGIVDERDVLAIGLNWQKTHGSAPSASPMLIANMDHTPYLFAYEELLEAVGTLPKEEPTIRIKEILREVILIGKRQIIPEKTAVLQNYPNPFNPETWIPFQLAEDAEVRVTIYSASGLRIRTLDLGPLSPGTYTDKGVAAYWDGKSDYGERASSGIYFCHVHAGDFTAIRKMILAK